MTEKKMPQSGICPAPCATRREQRNFIGGRKKFGGGGESECGMTQSNQKLNFHKLAKDNV